MTKKKKAIIIVFLILLALVLILTAWAVANNKNLKITKYVLKENGVPKSFSGYKIAQVSDLHNMEIGDKNERLIESIKEVSPDIIVLTGDLVDSKRTNYQVAIDFLEKIKGIAPCYYVYGNHESRLDDLEILTNGLNSAGVKILNDEKIKIEKDGSFITLVGITDPSFEVDYKSDGEEKSIKNTLDGFDLKREEFTILLSHRPEYFDLYKKYEIDLVLSGHTHGGQFVLPFIGGLYVPNQGFFPEFDYGKFSESGTKMIISRGIGRSTFPLRFNNNPELVVVELLHREIKFQ